MASSVGQSPFFIYLRVDGLQGRLKQWPVTCKQDARTDEGRKYNSSVSFTEQIADLSDKSLFASTKLAMMVGKCLLGWPA